MKIVGYRERVKVAAQINSRMTTNKDEKSKRALILNPDVNELRQIVLELNKVR